MWKRLPKQLLLGLLIFFVLTSITVYALHGSVNSPDEAANMLFAKSWRSAASLRVALPVQQANSYPLFPRSTAPSDSSVIPSGFIGLPIFFGSLSVLVGLGGVLYITILLTAIAAIGWWYLMKHVFGRAIADVSFWLFLFHPAVLYYSVRGLFPNMAMFDLIIIAFAAAWYAYLHRARSMIVLAVVAAVGAIAIRPPESLALISVAAISALVWGDARIRKIGSGIFVGALALGVVILVARALHWLPGGYGFVQLNSIAAFLFPFGVHLSRVWHTAFAFIVRLFSPWVLVSSAGLLWWLWHTWKTKSYDKTIAAYLTVVVPISFWLFIVYGSWSFSDNLKDPGAITLGSSYVRYWLPHLVFRMPFAAILLFVCVDRLKLSMRVWTRVFIIFAVLLGVWRAYTGAEGLWWLIGETRAARATVASVETVVPPNAVLAVRAWDKYFFPSRAVLQPFPQDVRTLSAAKELISRGTPVFALIDPLQETDRLWLRDNGVAAQEIATYAVSRLYQLHLWNE